MDDKIENMNSCSQCVSCGKCTVHLTQTETETGWQMFLRSLFEGRGARVRRAGVGAVIGAIIWAVCGCAPAKQVVTDQFAAFRSCALPVVATMATCLSQHDEHCVMTSAVQLLVCMTAHQPTPTAPPDAPAPPAPPARPVSCLHPSGHSAHSARSHRRRRRPSTFGVLHPRHHPRHQACRHGHPLCPHGECRSACEAILLDDASLPHDRRIPAL